MYTGDREAQQTEIQVFDYDPEGLRELQAASFAECARMRQQASTTWINVVGLQRIELVEQLGAVFDIHPLVLEDLLNTHQRPKLEDYTEYLFVVVQMLVYDESAREIQTEQVGLILGTGFVISFQEKPGDVFDGVRERLRHGRGRIRKRGPDYLLYALLDSIVDHYFVVLEKLDERIEQMEEHLADDPSTQALRDIHHLKREVIHLRKTVWPLRDVIGNLERDEHSLVQRETRLFLRDVYDHALRVAESVETFRDLLSSMLDLYMSTVSNRMNAVMKVLTTIATIFIPLTFIAGIYGMNFDYMPELRQRWGYPIAVGGMLLIAGVMVWLFKRRKWF